MARLVIKRRPSNAIGFDGTLNSGYSLELARVWRSERRAFITAVIVLTVAGAALSAPKIRIQEIPNLNQFWAHATFVYFSEFLSVLLLSSLLLYSLTSLVRKGIPVATAVVEKVDIAFHLFRPIDLDGEYPRYMHSLVMNRSNHLYNLLMVNDNFEQRVNWFAVNACPKILPVVLGLRKPDEFRLAKDNTGGFGLGMYIGGVIVPVGVYVLFLNAMQFYTMFFSLPLVALTLVAMVTPYLVSYLSYKAAVIRILSGKYPWETEGKR